MTITVTARSLDELHDRIAMAKLAGAAITRRAYVGAGKTATGWKADIWMEWV